MSATQDVLTLINRAKDEGIHLAVSDGKLLLKTNRKDQLDVQLIDSLKAHRQQIMDFFTGEAATVQDRSARPGIAGEDGNDASGLFPVSFAQERIWLIHQLNGSTNYHIPMFFRIQGRLDADALENAITTLISRHSVLRTILVEEDGVPWQKVRDAGEWRMKRMPCPASDDLDAVLQAEVAMPFRLDSDYMLRCTLITVSEEENILALVIHHIAFDGGSMPILTRELIHLYTAYAGGQTPRLPALKVQYRHYSKWQREHLNDVVLSRQLEYWKMKLRDLEYLEIPTDHIRPPEQSFKGSIGRYQIPEPMAHRLEELSRTYGVTTFMTLLAAYHVLLYRITGSGDITVGIPVSNRSQHEIEPLIGFFSNMLPIRHQVSGSMAFSEFLTAFRSTVTEAYANQDLPFEKVVDSVTNGRDLSRNPVFCTAFSFEEWAGSGSADAGDALLEPFFIERRTSKFDISFLLNRTGTGMSLTVEYCTDLFRNETIDILANCFIMLLTSVLSDARRPIGELTVLTPEMVQELVSGLNATQRWFDSRQNVRDLIEETSRRLPGKPCIALPGFVFTYGELKERSDQLAASLIENYGVTKGDIVALFMERGHWLLVGIMAAWKSGAAYLPIEPGMPPGRVTEILEDASPRVVITTSGHEASAGIDAWTRCIVDRQLHEPAVKGIDFSVSDPGSLAYIIYTSGSTGKPKGVMIEHHSLLNYCHSHQRLHEVDQDSRATLYCSISFDGSVLEMYPYLVAGGTLYPINDDEIRFDPMKLAGFLKEHTITHCYLPVSVVNELLRVKTAGVTTRILAGGEALRTAAGHGLRLSNNYGPTETTVVAALYQLKADSSGDIPIGRPIDNTAFYILDHRGQLMPKGFYGQICIAGEGVSRGYLKKEELTRSVFVKNPFAPELYPIMYMTGDMGRWNQDGLLEYKGRNDGQLKVRGFRVELGEIEAALQQSGVFETAVVVAREDSHGVRRLICYYSAPRHITRADIKEYLGERLPAYMHPEYFIKLDKFPLTDSGKIDRKRLPLPEDRQKGDAQSGRQPANAIEQQLISIWEEALHRTSIGVDDNFFELGGHSLLATRVMSAISRVFHQTMAISDLFRYPTIAMLAERVTRRRDASGSTLIGVQPGGSKAPVFCAPPGGGNVLVFYGLAKALGPDQPLLAFQAPGADLRSDAVDTVEEMAAIFIRDLLAYDDKGPYTLLGYSFGGYIAYEMALRLTEMGFTVRQLFILDTVAPDRTRVDYSSMLPQRYSEWLIYFKDLYNLSIDDPSLKIRLLPEELEGLTDEEQFQFFYERLAEKEKGITAAQLRAYTEMYRKNAGTSYVAEQGDPKAVPIVLFRAGAVLSALSEEQLQRRDELLQGRTKKADLGWGEFTKAGVTVLDVPCSHIEMMHEPYLTTIGKLITDHITTY